MSKGYYICFSDFIFLTRIHKETEAKIMKVVRFVAESHKKNLLVKYAFVITICGQLLISSLCVLPSVLNLNYICIHVNRYVSIARWAVTIYYSFFKYPELKYMELINYLSRGFSVMVWLVYSTNTHLCLYLNYISIIIHKYMLLPKLFP